MSQIVETLNERNEIIIDGIEHILVPTPDNVKGHDDCEICSLKSKCDLSNACFCCILFSDKPNSHFEIKY